MENACLKLAPNDDAPKVCRRSDVLDLIAKGEKIAQERIAPCPLREKVLEDYAQLREIVESALAKQLKVVVIVHRLMMAIVDAGKRGVLEVLADQEAETRTKIIQILDKFSDLDED